MSSITSIASVLFALASDPLVRVSGSSSCPTAEQVSRQLDRLLPRRPDDLEPDQARIDSVADGIHLELRLADGTLVGEKRFDRGASCAEMAEAVGIVVAIWERPLRPGLVPPLGAITAPEQKEVVPGAAPSETETGALARGGWRLEAGVGYREVFPGPAPGVLVEGVFRTMSGGVGPRVAIAGASWSDTDLGPGRVSWARWSAEAGLIHGWAGRRLFLDLHEQLRAGVFVARGRGYDEVRTASAFDWGLGAGVRVGVAVAALFRLWVDVGATVWPLKQTVRVNGIDQTIDGSRFEASLSIGGTFLTAR